MMHYIEMNSDMNLMNYEMTFLIREENVFINHEQTC